MTTVDDLIGTSYREPVDFIDLYFVYIDSDLSIEKIGCEQEELVDLATDTRGIHKDRLIQIIQSRRIESDKKYKLMQLMYFHVPLDLADLPGFLQNTASEYPHFMKTPTYLSHLVVENSLSVFHDLHSLFFFFKEDASKKSTKVVPKLSKTQKYKSILKNTDSNGSNDESDNEHNRTKKVRFHNEV